MKRLVFLATTIATVTIAPLVARADVDHNAGELPATAVPTLPSYHFDANAQDETRHVHVESDTDSENYMKTIGIGALFGGLTGFLVGGALYVLDVGEAGHIAYWAGGGVLLGTGVGITQVVVQENRAHEAVSLNEGMRFDAQPIVRIPLLLGHF